MKKIFISLLLFTTVALSAQDVPSSFPRKFLIEHFTTEVCGYCPYGMMYIAEYLYGKEEQCIWVSHHYGYYTDKFSIPANETIGMEIGVKGAPSIALNRVKRNVPEASKYTFHPGYLLDIAITDATTAEAALYITNTYDSISRNLHITVNGQTANTEAKEYLLTVLIKENKLVSKQTDYLFTWSGSSWKEYLHNRVVRTVLTDELGDTVKLENQTFTKDLDYTLPTEWKAEDCCIVAYITPITRAPIINAEQAPLIAGTTGGEEYVPWGITEGGSPKNYKKLTFNSVKTRKISDTQLELIMLSDEEIESNIYTSNHKLIARLYINTTGNTLPVDTIDIATVDTLGTVAAGYPVVDKMTWNGSHMAYAFTETITPELDVDSLVYAHVWLLKSGKVGFDHNGNIIMSGNFTNGTYFFATYTKPTTTDTDNIPFPETYLQKFMRNGQIVIQTNNGNYNVLGNKLQ